MTSDRKIQINAHGLTVVAALNDSDTADALWDQLPVTGAGADLGRRDLLFDSR